MLRLRHARRPLAMILGFWATMIVLTWRTAEEDTALAAAAEAAAAAARGEGRAAIFAGVDVVGGTVRALNLGNNLALDDRSAVGGIIAGRHESLNASDADADDGYGQPAEREGGVSHRGGEGEGERADVEWDDEATLKAMREAADRCDDGCVNGVCRHGRCRCDPGWEGADCSASMCARTAPKDRCRHGRCNNQRSCDCDPGYAGPVCAVRCVHGIYRPAPAKASAAAVMFGFHRAGCECMYGWGGLGCDQPSCGASQCGHGGNCVAPFKCKCAKGWMGPDCSVMTGVLVGRPGRSGRPTGGFTIDPKTGAGIVSEEQVFFRAKAGRSAREDDLRKCKRSMDTGDAAVRCVALRGEIAREERALERTRAAAAAAAERKRREDAKERAQFLTSGDWNDAFDPTRDDAEADDDALADRPLDGSSGGRNEGGHVAGSESARSSARGGGDTWSRGVGHPGTTERGEAGRLGGGLRPGSGITPRGDGGKGGVSATGSEVRVDAATSSRSSSGSMNAVGGSTAAVADDPAALGIAEAVDFADFLGSVDDRGFGSDAEVAGLNPGGSAAAALTSDVGSRSGSGSGSGSAGSRSGKNRPPLAKRERDKVRAEAQHHEAAGTNSREAHRGGREFVLQESDIVRFAPRRGGDDGGAAGGGAGGGVDWTKRGGGKPTEGGLFWGKVAKGSGHAGHPS